MLYLGVRDRWGFGASCGDGIGDGLVLCLGGDNSSGDLLERGGEVGLGWL